jgi:signal transduction histidine kinase
LKNHLEALDDGIVEMTHDEIKTCEVQIENLTAIISNLSNIVDVGKDKTNLNVELFEFNQLIRRIMAGIKVQFDRKSIGLDLLSDKEIYLSTDKYKLSQSIYNILANAYKFTESNGKVSIAYEVTQDRFVIEIQDDGIGIAKEEIDRIFDAYYSGKTHRTASGEGLGLYIAKENIEALKGTLAVESDLGKGSRFIITIPYIESDNHQQGSWVQVAFETTSEF